LKDLSIYGQESNPTTLRLAKMNLAIRGIDAKIELGDTFLADKHKAATLDEVRKNNHVLMPGRYVGTEAEEGDGIPFADKMKALTAKLAEQFTMGRELESLIRENLKGIGYEF